MRDPLRRFDEGHISGLVNWGSSSDEDTYTHYLTVTKLELTPEKALMLALIEDALHTIGHNKSLLLARAAMEWIENRDKEYLFAFENCCTTLGLNPDFVRRQIKWVPQRKVA